MRFRRGRRRFGGRGRRRFGMRRRGRGRGFRLRGIRGGQRM